MFHNQNFISLQISQKQNKKKKKNNDDQDKD